MDSYKSLIVWQRADELADKVYKATREFPDAEQFGLTSQLRRAAVSIPVNIVEGVGRQSKAELKRFTGISLGSFAEVEYLVHFSNKQGFLTDNHHQLLKPLLNQVGSLLWRFYKSL